MAQAAQRGGGVTDPGGVEEPYGCGAEWFVGMVEMAYGWTGWS